MRHIRSVAPSVFVLSCGGAMMLNFQGSILKEAERIRVDCEVSDGAWESFSFLVEPKKSLVECNAGRRVLGRLASIDGNSVGEIHSRPSRIMEALFNHQGKELMFIFFAANRCIQTRQVRVFAVYHN